jgi:hypothetical protein
MDQPKPRRGRPPEGLGKKGEPARIRDYPRRLFTLRPATLGMLHAISKHEHRAEWRIIEDGIRLYFDQISLEARRAIERMAKGPGIK